MSDPIQRHQDGHGLWCRSDDVDELEAELLAMIEDRDLWQGQHNDDCPNETEVEKLKGQIKRNVDYATQCATVEKERDILLAELRDIRTEIEDLREMLFEEVGEEHEELDDHLARNAKETK